MAPKDPRLVVLPPFIIIPHLHLIPLISPLTFNVRFSDLSVE
jgi:hypothetical protein